MHRGASILSARCTLTHACDAVAAQVAPAWTAGFVPWTGSLAQTTLTAAAVLSSSSMLAVGSSSTAASRTNNTILVSGSVCLWQHACRFAAVKGPCRRTPLPPIGLACHTPHLQRSADGGASWADVGVAPKTNLNAIAAAPGGGTVVWAVGDAVSSKSTLLKSTDTGVAGLALLL